MPNSNLDEKKPDLSSSSLSSDRPRVAYVINIPMGVASDSSDSEEISDESDTDSLPPSRELNQPYQNLSLGGVDDQKVYSK